MMMVDNEERVTRSMACSLLRTDDAAEAAINNAAEAAADQAALDAAAECTEEVYHDTRPVASPVS